MISIKSYFYVLCDEIVAEFRNRTYYKLMETLFYEPYDDIFGKEASVLGGIEELRERCNAPMNFPYSMLEMLVAIVFAMSLVTDYGLYDDDISSYYFWDIISCLGLEGMDDEHFDGYLVRTTISALKNRQYSYDGNFGMFGKLEYSEVEDIRSLSIWDQAMLYISENNFEALCEED